MQKGVSHETSLYRRLFNTMLFCRRLGDGNCLDGVLCRCCDRVGNDRVKLVLLESGRVGVSVDTMRNLCRHHRKGFVHALMPQVCCVDGTGRALRPHESTVRGLLPTILNMMISGGSTLTEIISTGIASTESPRPRPWPPLS